MSRVVGSSLDALERRKSNENSKKFSPFSVFADDPVPSNDFSNQIKSSEVSSLMFCKRSSSRSSLIDDDSIMLFFLPILMRFLTWMW